MASRATLDRESRVKFLFFEDALGMKMIAAMFVVVALWKITLVVKRFLRSDASLNLPPGPLNLPVVGAIFSIDPKTGEWYQKMSKKFGKIFYFRLGSHGILVVCSVEGAMEVLKTKDNIFSDRPINGIMKSAAKCVGFDSEDVSFTNYDEKHKNLKKLLTSNFFTISKVNRFEYVRRREGKTDMVIHAMAAFFIFLFCHKE
jgi:hypothetical protein